jgi:hypothetical protein
VAWQADRRTGSFVRAGNRMLLERGRSAGNRARIFYRWENAGRGVELVDTLGVTSAPEGGAKSQGLRTEYYDADKDTEH